MAISNKEHFRILVDRNNIYEKNEKLKNVAELIEDNLNSIVSAVERFAGFSDNDNLGTEAAEEFANITDQGISKLRDFVSDIYENVNNKLEKIDEVNTEFEQKFADLINAFDDIIVIE